MFEQVNSIDVKGIPLFSRKLTNLRSAQESFLPSKQLTQC